MLTLSIAHNIFLKDSQIKELSEKKKIKITGVSVPVWFFKGTTSEPGTEVFCNYTISYKEDDFTILPINDGYKISIQGDLKSIRSNTMHFKRSYKIKEKGRKMNVVHYIELKSTKALINSLILD